jgi:hypothetical protein
VRYVSIVLIDICRSCVFLLCNFFINAFNGSSFRDFSLIRDESVLFGNQNYKNPIIDLLNNWVFGSFYLSICVHPLTV